MLCVYISKYVTPGTAGSYCMLQSYHSYLFSFLKKIFGTNIVSIHFNPTFWYHDHSGTDFFNLFLPVLYKLFNSIFFLKCLFPPIHPPPPQDPFLFIQIMVYSYSTLLITLVSFTNYFSLSLVNQIYHVFICEANSWLVLKYLL